MPGADPVPPPPAVPPPAPPPNVVMFLPWLSIAAPATVAGVTFVPWRHHHGAVCVELRAAEQALATILAAYVDIEGTPITNCVVATTGNRGALLTDQDFEAVRWASSLLFLSAWAMNDYFVPHGGRYVSAAHFRLVAQRYIAAPVWIGLSSRHRDGPRLNGGYRHDDLSFTVPAQCFPVAPATIDARFLTALDAAHGANSPTMVDVKRAIPFVELANADDDFMTVEAEAILMASAFEQLLHGDASAYKLTRKFGVLFNSCGSVTVATALLARQGIQIDNSTPERAAAQPQWWVHRKWIEELYDLRSKTVHGGVIGHRTWGWTPFEHLVMAAVVFPLAVKLLLQRDGVYTVSTEDRATCGAVDEILAATDWREDNDGDGPAWHRVMAQRLIDARFDARARAAGWTISIALVSGAAVWYALSF